MVRRQIRRAVLAMMLAVAIVIGQGCAASPSATTGPATPSASAPATVEGSSAAVATAAPPSATTGTASDPGYAPVDDELLTIQIGQDYAVLPPAKGVYAGIFEPPAPFGYERLEAYGEKFDKPAAIVLWYQAWEPDEWIGDFKEENVREILKRGAIPMITWEPWVAGAGVKQPKYRLSTIINGDWDEYIRSWARAAKSIDGPIMIRPFHEMNGEWYPWGGTVNGNKPSDVKKAWIHVHDIFEEEGATNVTWVWSINWESYPNTYANRFDAYYPGDEYVDWTSISGFNWGKTRTRPQGRSFTNIYTKPLAYLKTVGKPVVISEIGCNSNVDKAAWIKDAYTRVLLKYPHVKGICYYDKREPNNVKGTQDWQISSSKSSERAYRSAMSSRMYIGGSPTSLLGTVTATP